MTLDNELVHVLDWIEDTRGSTSIPRGVARPDGLDSHHILQGRRVEIRASAGEKVRSPLLRQPKLRPWGDDAQRDTYQENTVRRGLSGPSGGREIMSMECLVRC